MYSDYPEKQVIPVLSVDKEITTCTCLFCKRVGTNVFTTRDMNEPKNFKVVSKIT